MIKGDKIKLIKPMGVFTNIGEVCEVVNITEDGVISFKFGGCHLGCMSYDGCDKYFEKVESKKRQWSEWHKETLMYLNTSGNIFEDNVFYRTNGKVIQAYIYVKHEKVKSKCSCHENDIFNLKKGLSIVKGRLLIKILNQELKANISRIWI